MVHCHFDYACSSWYSSLSKGTQSKLQICQNKLIRTVLKLPARTHLYYSHFNTLNWLPVEKRVIQLKLNHVHKIYHGNSPSYLVNYFTPFNVSHGFKH